MQLCSMFLCIGIYRNISATAEHLYFIDLNINYSVTFLHIDIIKSYFQSRIDTYINTTLIK